MLNYNFKRKQLKELKETLKKEKVFYRDGQFQLVMTEVAVLKQFNKQKRKSVA